MNSHPSRHTLPQLFLVGRELKWLAAAFLSGERSGHTAFSYASMGVMTLFLLGKLRALQRERWQMLTLLGSLAPVALATCIAVRINPDVHTSSERVTYASSKW